VQKGQSLLARPPAHGTAKGKNTTLLNGESSISSRKLLILLAPVSFWTLQACQYRQPQLFHAYEQPLFNMPSNVTKMLHLRRWRGVYP
jgi:hypothetical protein